MSVAPLLSPEILAQQLMMRKATRASLAVALGLIALFWPLIQISPI